MKSKRVNVSVIMPAFNVAGSIDEAIRSVLIQEGVSFELLVGDDGSADDTWTRISAYRFDPRIRAFRIFKNQGVSKMRNYLIAKAKGKYISLCDADDCMLRQNLSTLAGILEKNSNVGVAYGDLLKSSLNGTRRIKRRFVLRHHWDLLGGYFPNGGVMIRKILLKNIKGYSAKLPFLEDCDLFLRLSELTSFYYFRGKPLYHQKKKINSLSEQPLELVKKTSQDLLRAAIQRRYGYRVKW